MLGLPGVCIAAFQNRGVQILREKSQDYVLRRKVALTDLSGHLGPYTDFKDNIESFTDLPEAAYDLALLLGILKLQAMEHFQGIFQALIAQ